MSGVLISQVHYPDASTSCDPGPVDVVVNQPALYTAGARKTCSGGGATNTATYANVNYYYATCQSSDLVGNLVVASGQQGQIVTADASSPIPVIGVLISKQSSTTCTVQTFGIITGIYRDLLANTQYFLGKGGQIVAPPFDNTIQFVQGIGSSVDSTTIYLRPSGSSVRRDTSDS